PPDPPRFPTRRSSDLFHSATFVPVGRYAIAMIRGHRKAELTVSIGFADHCGGIRRGKLQHLDGLMDRQLTVGVIDSALDAIAHVDRKSTRLNSSHVKT